MDPGRLPGLSYGNFVPGLKEIVVPNSVQISRSGWATQIQGGNRAHSLKEIVLPISAQLNGSRGLPRFCYENLAPCLKEIVSQNLINKWIQVGYLD